MLRVQEEKYMKTSEQMEYRMSEENTRGRRTQVGRQFISISRE